MTSHPLVAMAGLLLAAVSLQAQPLKIACIGDSITEGSGLSTPALESYPAKLQRLLGTNDYTVRNYGVSGRTLLKKGDFPYWKESQFKASHDWQPDIVIIQLGTNDGKPYNWKYGTNFVSDYEEMIASYASLTNAPEVVLCTPCPVYKNGAFDIRPGTVATNIAPAVRDLATRLQLDLIDLQIRMADHPELFPDTVHPNAKGTTVMASIMAEALLRPPRPETAASLAVTRVSSSRLFISWPAEQRTLVPQSTTALRGTNTVWTVSEPVIYDAGTAVRQTNSISGPTRIYRLWQP
ncbi:MAG: GDSL-type esterase/lipase family protein [Verrucomicrobiota bacterium]